MLCVLPSWHAAISGAVLPTIEPPEDQKLMFVFLAILLNMPCLPIPTHFIYIYGIYIDL